MSNSTFPGPRRGPYFAPETWFPAVLAVLAALALVLRLWRATHAAWYWDEGYLAEWALDLGRLRRPHSGAVWFNGVLPLTTSWLAPLSAAPFTWFLQKNALLAVRLWAAVLGSVSTVLLGLIGRRLGGWKLGLAAAALFALGRFPVVLGGMGLYHHLGCALGLAALWLALPSPRGETGPDWLPWLPAGLAAAACYWMWWLPLALCFKPSTRRLKSADWAARLACGFGPLVFVLGQSWGLGGPDARKMWNAMASYNFMDTYVHYLRQFPSLSAVSWKGFFDPLGAEALKCVQLFPVVFIGLACLALVGRKRAWVWLAAVLGMAELFRQRGCLIGCPYVLSPLLPWICLGLALGALRLGSALPGRGAGGVLAWVLALGLLNPTHLQWMSRLFVPPRMARNLKNYLKTQRCEDETVITVPNIEWLLRQVCRPVEFSQAAAYRGWSGGLLPAHLSRAAFAYDPGLDHARFLVTTPEVFDVDFGAAHLAVEGLDAEVEGWPKVFANPCFRVYENPRFGVRPDPNTRILGSPTLYRLAAKDALALGRPAWAALARERAATAWRYKVD